MSRGKLDANPKALLGSIIGPDEVRLYESADHYQNFLDCLRSRREAATPAEVAHRSISIAHLGNVAMRNGRALEWDPDRETFPGEPGANRLLETVMRSPWRL